MSTFQRPEPCEGEIVSRSRTYRDVNPNDHERAAEPAPEPPTEGEYLAPTDHPASGRNWRAAGGSAVGLAVLAAKFKGVLFALLNIKWIFFGAKFGLTAVSFLASIWFYALFFGWKFGIVFVLLIAIHEVGHVLFVRSFGLSAPAIVFLPGMGAFTTWTGSLDSAYQEAIIAFGGPLLGTLGGLTCLGFGLVTGEQFWIAAAYSAFFLNLINMVPFGFFDGGRITGAISPSFWIGGLIVIVAAAFAFHWFSPILLIFVILGIPKAVAAFRGKLDPQYYKVTTKQRTTVSVLYFGLLALLTASLVFSHVEVPGHAGL
jgi:Zn-dependent protease